MLESRRTMLYVIDLCNSNSPASPFCMCHEVDGRGTTVHEFAFNYLVAKKSRRSSLQRTDNATRTARQCAPPCSA